MHWLSFHSTMFISCLVKPEYPVYENTSMLALVLYSSKTSTLCQRSAADTLDTLELHLLKLLWPGEGDGCERFNTDDGL